MKTLLEEVPPLDVLIYAHDGRGLGHASRSIAIGMALRRLQPECRVLFVTGCKVSQELIDTVPLDWLKLPSYETEVVAGKSKGRDGHSNFSDQDLGLLRGEELKNIFLLYRPRVVLCDHSPQGKHRELIPTLKAERGFETLFVLGVRGVIGAVSQIQSSLSQELFEHYHSLLWYGDSIILGKEHMEQLNKYSKKESIECGYVSRLAELKKWNKIPIPQRYTFAGTVSIPWLGEHTLQFIGHLAMALKQIGASHGTWRLFIGCEVEEEETLRDLFRELPFCQLEKPGSRYVEALQDSKIALVYGGYNSLMDILHLSIPSVVVLRGMADNEQQVHLQQLKKFLDEQLAVCDEDTIDVRELYQLLLQRLTEASPKVSKINLRGSEGAAEYLLSLLSLSHCAR